MKTKASMLVIVFIKRSEICRWRTNVWEHPRLLRDIKANMDYTGFLVSKIQTRSTP